MAFEVIKAKRHRILLSLSVSVVAAMVSEAGVATSAASSAAASSPRAALVTSGGDLVTYDYDNARSGEDPVDPHIKSLSAQPAWNDNALDGAVFGEPLVESGRVYVATENDSIYSIDATTGAVLWKLHVGNAVSLQIVNSTPTLGSGCGNIDPLGITGTPVIDPTANELFVTEETEPGGSTNWRHVRHWVVAISLSTHRELWHRDVDPPNGNNASYYYIPAEQQRPAMTLANGNLYVAFGGLSGDCGQYHGYVVDLPESGVGALESYQVPTQREGAIWETNGVLVTPQGDIYVATGNGSSNTVQSFDEGNAIVELSPSLARLGVWAPSNWVQLNDDDWDLGSAGPIQVPNSSLLFVAGKPAANGSFGYLMTEGQLGGIGHGAFTGAVCTSGGAFGGDASDVIGSGAGARTMIYVPCGGGTVAVEVDLSSKRFHRVWSASQGSPNGSPIVAGGAVWALNWDDGELYGMNPLTGHVFIQRGTDSLPHFATPGVGDGSIFVPTNSGVEAFRTVAS